MVLFDAATAFKTAKELVKAIPLTKVHGKPTYSDMEKSREECMQKLASVDMRLFPDSHGRFGLMGALMEGTLYTEITGLVYVEQEQPSSYPEAVDANTDDFERKRQEAQNATANDAFNRAQGAYEGINELVREAYDVKHFKKLKQEHIASPAYIQSDSSIIYSPARAR